MFSQNVVSVICNQLDQPVGGYVELNSDGQNTTALHTCVTGFTLVGKSELTCKSDGSWDFSQPSCGRYIHVFYSSQLELYCHF